jgi:hypothetical protein
MIPDLLAHHPQARARRLLESLGFFAATHGVDDEILLAELKATVEESATARAASPGADHVAASAAENVADTIYRRFFLGGIALILTAGASWGSAPGRAR